MSELPYARPAPYEPRPLEVVYLDSPAAGASFSLTSPGRDGWRLIAVHFQLVTDATVGNRAVTVDYDDGNGRLFGSNGTDVVVAATLTRVFRFQQNIGQPYSNTSGQVFAPLLPVELQRGQKLQVNVLNVQAGDQLSALLATFQRQLYAPS